MKIALLVENLEENLTLINRTIPTHVPVPVLSHVLLEATREGFFITSTDLEFGVKINIPAKIEEIGSVAVPGKQFIETILALPKEKILIELINEELVIRCRGNIITIATISKDEFPNLYEEKGEQVLYEEKEEINKLFTSVIFATATEESRPELTGILFKQAKNGLEIVTTDGFRMALRKVPGKHIFKEEKQVIISQKVIKELISLKMEGKVGMYVLESVNQVIFELGQKVLVGRLINGSYPEYERVIPKEHKTTLGIEVQDFLQNLRLAAVFARESAHIVKLQIQDGQMMIFSQSSGVGKGELTIEVDMEGENNEVSFNEKFLLEFLKSVQAKRVTIELNSGVEPVAFKIENDPNFIHVIMPVRIQE